MDAPCREEPIGLLLTRAAKTVSRSFDAALAERGGSLPTWLVLVSLSGEEHSSQRSIAAAVGVEGPTLTHHLNRMEAEGLVTRARDPQNRRAHEVELTGAGRAAFRSRLRTVMAFDERLRAGFTDDELTTLRDLIHRLAANAATSSEPQREETPMTTDIDEVLSTWTTAERTGDAGTLDTILANEFVGIGPVGFVLDKATWVGRFEHGLRYEQLDLDELAIHRHGNTAVVVAHQHAVGDAGGTPVPADTRVSFTIVTGDDSDPKIAALQYSFIGPPLGGPH